jgi:hypothetical protein
MSAGHRGLPAHTRSLALLLPPLLAGLLLTAAPAAAAPVDPGSRSAESSAVVGLTDQPVLVPADLQLLGTSDAPEAVQVTIAVSAAGVPASAGTVSVSENGSLLLADLPVIDGAAAYRASDVSPGEHVYTVAYSGADGIAAASGTVAVTVRGRAAATLTVTPTSPADGTVSLQIQVAAAAAGEPTVGGTVEVREDGALLAGDLVLQDGSARYEATDVTPGPHTYAVSYLGTDRIAPATSTVSITVSAQATLSVVPSSPTIGKLTLRISVSASGTPVTVGTVTIKEGSKTVASALAVKGGQASWSPTGLKPGSRHTYAVTYSGAGAVKAASATVTATVQDLASPRFSVGSTSTAVGRLVLRVGVSALGKPASGGTVTVKEGRTTVKAKIKVSRGLAVWSARGLKSGKHTYAISFSGTATVKRGSARTVATVKAKAKPTVTLSASSPAPQKVSVKIAVAASGQSSLGGSVGIKEGRKRVKAKILVKRGKASWSASKVTAGRHTYTVTYSGTSQVTGRSAKVSVSVKKPVVVKAYKNCTALNAAYPHGVGRVGASDKVSGSTKPVTDFIVSTALYNANTKSDRDKDGVACEKR